MTDERRAAEDIARWSGKPKVVAPSTKVTPVEPVKPNLPAPQTKRMIAE